MSFSSTTSFLIYKLKINLTAIKFCILYIPSKILTFKRFEQWNCRNLLLMCLKLKLWCQFTLKCAKISKIYSKFFCLQNKREAMNRTIFNKDSNIHHCQLIIFAKESRVDYYELVNTVWSIFILKIVLIENIPWRHIKNGRTFIKIDEKKKIILNYLPTINDTVWKFKLSLKAFSTIKLVSF